MSSSKTALANGTKAAQTLISHNPKFFHSPGRACGIPALSQGF